MQEVDKPSVNKWFIAYNDDIETVYHFGEIHTDQSMKTAMDNLELFTTEAEYLARLSALGIPADQINP